VNLFENIDRVEELNNKIKFFASDNGFNLLCKEKHWHLFQQDVLKVEIRFIRRNNKLQIELKTPLFECINKSLEIFIRPICCEKQIRDIIKSDSIVQDFDKIFLIRYLNETVNIYKKRTIIYNINSMLRKAKALQEEISGLLDFTMFIKLN